MNESFDVQLVLHDVLEVLRRHNIPVATASVNVSLFDASFDEHIPQLKTYQAGNFHRSTVIDEVPFAFRAQRRYPFAEIVQELDREIQPPLETFAQAVQPEYPHLKIQFRRESTTRSPDVYSYQTPDLHSYQLGISCRFSDELHEDYNQLDLVVLLQQHEATTYPHLTAYVGWLVDEEGEGDWGLDIVWRSIGGLGSLDYAPHQRQLLQRALPSYFLSFRQQILRKLSGEPMHAH